jgi:glutamine amidotransferase
MSAKSSILIVDYGMGNIQSVQNAFERLGCSVSCSANPADLKKADAIVLPGVGAFGEAVSHLKQSGMDHAVKDAVLNEGRPVLAVCLGMQLLAEESEERGSFRGLGLVPGSVRHIPVPPELRLPHMGWNALRILKREPIYEDVPEGGSVYFVHSYRFETDIQFISAVTDYGGDITASVQRDHIFGAQFHPERSQTNGLKVIRNFVRYVDQTVKAPASC